MSPFPQEHSCRLLPPGNFQKGRFRRMQRKSGGKIYSIIIGRLKGQTNMTEQAYRYDRKSWSAAKARKHCSDHEGRFEAAEGE